MNKIVILENVKPYLDAFTKSDRDFFIITSHLR